MQIQLTERAKEWLANQGFDEDFGARPLKRALQRYVESPLSVKLLKGTFNDGDYILIDEEDGELTFQRLEPAEPPLTKDEEVSAA